jgi:hypothetical protein
MQPSLLSNGVKARRDGAGDEWAKQHRSLGPTYNMQDMDALFGVTAFGQNTGERLFLEYVPDNYQNRTSVIRNFGVVAMFDRKQSEPYAFSRSNAVSTAFYLYQCRIHAKVQPNGLTPKFFFVIGGQSPPWKMIEIDIFSGKKTGLEAVICDGERDWKRVWTTLGLHQLRQEIRRWIDL